MARLPLLLGLLVLLGLLAATVQAQDNHVDLLQIRGTIDPAMADYIDRGIAQAEGDGAQAVIIEMDTPGGLMDSMREITQRIISARVPVVVYVSPQGARAASAGVFITMAAHVAAMAPNTNIGAAHPVELGGPGVPGGQSPDNTLLEKITNDAVASIRSMAQRRGRNADWAERSVRESISHTEQQALNDHVVDLLADDMPGLLRQLDGREVTLAGGKTTLRTADATVRRVDMSLLEDFLHTISNPNIAYILLILGIYGLIYELASPGAILPGVIGVISLLLAFYALGTLPVNYVGLGLIFFAIVMFIADVLVTSHGVLTGGGLIALTLGSLMLFNSPSSGVSVAWPVIAGVVLATGGFFFFVIAKVIRARLQPAMTGREELLQATGVARTDLSPQGYVFLQGELWKAVSEDGNIPKGTSVKVLSEKGLTLYVRQNKENG
ncbi:MAG: nodulation protein NfeD [Bacteroidetes bacterium]|nr:nodulation protein NfeD [Bacteroidota bacterium]MCL5026908.1 nodulation protein NfeD [Chloroflexota bacterium]